MGVGVYGCMPCSGGGEKKMRPHKEKDVPGVGAMGCARNISATSWGLMTIPNHQFVDIRRILHIEFTFLILNSGHQGGVVNTLHSSIASSIEQPVSSITYLTNSLRT